MTTPYVIFIMGPTAAGKTRLAVQLHQALNCEIISVDSAMIYRDMDIGTAKPSPAVLKHTPHHLINICDPAESYSVARFQQDANSAIKKILAKSKIPLLVGGTGLYFRMLQTGLTRLPKADPAIRAALEDEAEKKGRHALYQRLQAVDPKTAKRISQNDSQRIQRALEIYHITGNTLSAMLASKGRQPFPYPIKKIVLVPEDRKVLHQHIEQRFLAMLASGLVDEVQALYQRGDLSLNCPSIRLVGYRQIWHYLQGYSDYQTMQQRAIVATRQLAKRQTTWCRSETHATWYDPYKTGTTAKILKDLALC